MRDLSEQEKNLRIVAYSVDGEPFWGGALLDGEGKYDANRCHELLTGVYTPDRIHDPAKYGEEYEITPGKKGNRTTLGILLPKDDPAQASGGGPSVEDRTQGAFDKTRNLMNKLQTNSVSGKNKDFAELPEERKARLVVPFRINKVIFFYKMS